jgi:hypothetical protein
MELGIVLLGTIMCAIAALVIEETTDISPAQFLAVTGVFAGIGVMRLVRKADERDGWISAVWRRSGALQQARSPERRTDLTCSADPGRDPAGATAAGRAT